MGCALVELTVLLTGETHVPSAFKNYLRLSLPPLFPIMAASSLSRPFGGGFFNYLLTYYLLTPVSQTGLKLPPR